MAKNTVFEEGYDIPVTVTYPAVPVSGQFCRYGSKIAVARANEDTVSGQTPVTFRGVHMGSVVAANAGGSVAVAPGDQLYWADGANPISKIATGIPCGIACEGVFEGVAYTGAVASGATAIIPIKL